MSWMDDLTRATNELPLFDIDAKENGDQVMWSMTLCVKGSCSKDNVRNSVKAKLKELVSLSLHEPPPGESQHPPVWDMVVEDMKQRNEMGTEKYGTPLRPFNGRNSLKDAYQEVLDLAVYLRQRLYEEGQ